MLCQMIVSRGQGPYFIQTFMFICFFVILLEAADRPGQARSRTSCHFCHAARCWMLSPILFCTQYDWRLWWWDLVATTSFHGQRLESQCLRSHRSPCSIWELWPIGGLVMFHMYTGLLSVYCLSFSWLAIMWAGVARLHPKELRTVCLITLTLWSQRVCLEDLPVSACYGVRGCWPVRPCSTGAWESQ